MPFPGAPSALRPFRQLHLYTLHRLRGDAANEYRLRDGVVEVVEPRGTLLEVVQAGGAFDAAALRTRFKQHPNATHRFVSFEPVAPWVRSISAAAGQLDGEARMALERAEFSRKQIDALRGVFVVEEIGESSLSMDEQEFLFLSSWLAASRSATAVDVRERLKLIDATLPAFEAVGAEDARSQDVESAFVRANVVVIHGADRDVVARAFLHSGMPAAWRVRFDGLIPRELAKKARAFGVPLLVFVDATRERGWTGVVEGLRNIKGVRVLVTTTDAAWKRAQNSGAALLYADVALEADDEEEQQQHIAEPRTWADAGEALRARLAEAARTYVRENAELIESVQKQLHGPELAWAVLDPVGLSLLDVNEVFGSAPELRAWLDDVERRKPEDALASARVWLASQRAEFETPQSTADWE
ncbi:MAG: hypothetical protein M3Q69_21995, partial [Acidobacteriota bacterium]|nr:hypothetical protein [Acidobacteriota bacterium]